MTATTISVQPNRDVAGPISQDGHNVLDLLINNGEAEPATLMEKVSLIRSRFWKVVFDLKALGLVKLNHK